MSLYTLHINCLLLCHNSILTTTDGFEAEEHKAEDEKEEDEDKDDKEAEDGEEVGRSGVSACSNQWMQCGPCVICRCTFIRATITF